MRTIVVAIVLISSAVARAESDANFIVPDGFEVSLYADDDLAHDIFSMTVDAKGRVVVAGKDYVKILHDTDADGRADKATLFADRPRSGAHGMYFDGPDLIVSGDNTLMVLRDRDGDDRADNPNAPEVWAMLRHPEHGTNGIVKGPDGWVYVICGNDAGVSEQHAKLTTSPVKQPGQGALVRFTPDGRDSEVYAHGFRNPYDMDFHPWGHALTYDADGERDHHLPWYAPTRIFDIAQGMHHGWVLPGFKRAWNRPPWFFDSVERIAEPGRGSPTGVLVYRHKQFPERYRHGVFAVCWTFGRVYFIPMTPEGATFDGRVETFLQTSGNVGFAPVDIAVGPGGDMFIAIGGRGTRGGVYRIRYAPGNIGAPIADSPLLQVLDAPQPLSSWSRAVWIPAAQKLGRDAFAAALLDDNLTVEQRIRAVEVMVEVFHGVPVDVARQAAVTAPPPLAARLAWAMARQAYSPAAHRLAAELTHHEHPLVQRAAWETIANTPPVSGEDDLKLNWMGARASTDRRVRAAMILAARGSARAQFDRYGSGPKTPRSRLVMAWVIGPDFKAAPNWGRKYFELALKAFESIDDHALRLEAVRLLQLGLDDIQIELRGPEANTGYAANDLNRFDADWRADVIDRIGSAFPTGVRELDYEIARLMGMLRAERPALLSAIATRFSESSSVEDDIHYLMAMAQMPGQRPINVTDALAHAFTSLHHKMDRGELYPSRNWAERVRETFLRHVEHDPKLLVAFLEDPAFGRVEHVMMLEGTPHDIQLAAAEKALAAALAGTIEWSPELVHAIHILPAQRLLPHLRERWNDPRLRDEIAIGLAIHARPEDRTRLIEALGSVNPATATTAALALTRMSGKASASEIRAAVAALRQHEKTNGVELAQLLQSWTGQEHPGRFTAWRDWLAAAHPDEAAKLTGFTQDTKALAARLAAIDWTPGDAKRGEIVYQARACATCHAGSRRLGPDLKNITQRFSRDDLFAHIVNPNLAISDLYKAVQITTTDGRVFIGAQVYESPESTILEIAPGQTVRIFGNDVAKLEPATNSPMPAGLLTGASDQDLADLYEYMRSLK